MSYDNLSVSNKIRWAKHKIHCAENSVQFWKASEEDLQKKYAGSKKSYEHKHIRDIRAYRKQAQDELKYWTDELKKLELLAA